MTKEILIARLAELRQIMANAQANLNAMRGQEIEIKFWIGQFELQEQAPAEPPAAPLAFVKAAEGPTV